MRKLNRKQLRRLIYETTLRESAQGKAREYSMKNPDDIVHLYDSEKSQVIVIKDGEDIKRVDAPVGSKAYKNMTEEKTGSILSDTVKTFGFGSGEA